MDKINSYHRQAEFELAFQQLPTVMEALYDRMAMSVSQIPSAANRALASNILQFVACSLCARKVVDLSEALPDDISEMLDLERSIVDLCGGFVVIDNSGKTNKRLLYVDGYQAHEQLFRSCMRCLMTTGLRADLNRGKTPGASGVARLRSCILVFPCCVYKGNSQAVLRVLRKFLMGHCVLTWIQILAASGKLRGLVQASRHLSRFTSTQNKLGTSGVEFGSNMLQQEIMESWAVDLVKVIAKFGSILRRNPEAIHKFVPPFCPRNSAIYQQFGNAKSQPLKVSGLSTDKWDDAIARIPFGIYTFSLSAAGTLVAVLATSGNVLIYDSAVFEECSSSPIKHGERVYRIELNSSATLLATYSYQTLKI